MHAARRQHLEAEQLAREAVEFSFRSDSPLIQGNALADFGQVLEAAGRHDQAAAAYREALDRYERKQTIPSARRTREQLSALKDEPSSRTPTTTP